MKASDAKTIKTNLVEMLQTALQDLQKEEEQEN